MNQGKQERSFTIDSLFTTLKQPFCKHVMAIAISFENYSGICVKRTPLVQK